MGKARKKRDTTIIGYDEEFNPDNTEEPIVKERCQMRFDLGLPKTTAGKQKRWREKNDYKSHSYYERQK